MQAVNKETGKDITRHILDYMEKKITKKEFEELTGLSKDTNEAIKENDPFYKSDSYLDDPKPSEEPKLSSKFVFEPNDPKKDLMIHKIVDEYQEKIFDYLWNYELYKNEYGSIDKNDDIDLDNRSIFDRTK